MVLDFTHGVILGGDWLQHDMLLGKDLLMDVGFMRE